jgi:hypothetical protein
MDVSCPDNYTTKLDKAWARAWVAFGGVGGVADLRDARDAITLDCAMARAHGTQEDPFPAGTGWIVYSLSIDVDLLETA